MPKNNHHSSENAGIAKFPLRTREPKTSRSQSISCVEFYPKNWLRTREPKVSRSRPASLPHRIGVSVLAPEEQFRHYVNPFELLEAESNADPKTLLRLKKVLLQEIELEDGKVASLDGHVLDRSRALAICDELNDQKLCHYHVIINEDEKLSRFLTRGDIQYFRDLPAKSHPKATEYLKGSSDFHTWLSPMFARQYDLVLTRALEKKQLSVVKALFSGRKWASQAHDDLCFASAGRLLARMLAPLENLAETARTKAPKPSQVAKAMEGDHFVEIFNLLPEYFRDIQNKAVSLLRDIAIRCNNEHKDPSVSRKILILSKKFDIKNPALQAQINEDFNTIEKIINEESSRVFSALIRTDETLTIDKQGVQYGRSFIALPDIEAIRWGVYIETSYGAKRSQNFSMAFRGSGAFIDISWGMRGVIGFAKSLFRDKNAAVPVAELTSDEQEVHFRKMVDSAVYFIVPVLLNKLISRARDGHSYNIGPCTVLREGVSFETGLIFKSNHTVPWHDIFTHIANGEVYVSSRANPRKDGVIVSLKNTENAVLLPYLCEAMAK